MIPKQVREEVRKCRKLRGKEYTLLQPFKVLTVKMRSAETGWFMAFCCYSLTEPMAMPLTMYLENKA